MSNHQLDYNEVRDRARSNISLGSAGELYQDYVHEPQQPLDMIEENQHSQNGSFKSQDEDEIAQQHEELDDNILGNSSNNNRI